MTDNAWAYSSNFLIGILSDKEKTRLILASTLGVLVISYLIRKWLNLRNFFKRMNLPGPRPFPLLGNINDMRKKGIYKHDIELFKTYGKIVGYFEGPVPVILTTDVKFLKSIFIKDFSSFVNHRSKGVFMTEPVEKFLTMLNDDEWKNVRSLLSSTFTSGKLKGMSKSMLNCIKNYDAYLHDLCEKDGILETKKFFGSYTMDVISSCCFGIDTNAINDPNNAFTETLKKIMASVFAPSPKLIIGLLAPSWFAKFLVKHKMIEFFPMSCLEFLKNVTNEIIDRRKSKKEKRDDFIQCMVEHEENNESSTNEGGNNRESISTTWNGPLKKTLTNSEILAQAILFFLAGYDTTANTLDFVGYHLAMYPNVQDKLIAEIDHVLEQHSGEINYESIGDMKYMEMVIDETLRLYPPLVRSDRVAGNDYEYEGVKIKKGQAICACIYALHRDPDIYPEPNEFRPERFDEANKKARDSMAFIPFSAGPRNCIAMRFAMIEMKLLIASILSKYRLERCEKTPDTIVLGSMAQVKSVKPIFVKVLRR